MLLLYVSGMKIIREYWIYFGIIILLSIFGTIYVFDGKNAPSDLIKVTKMERIVLGLPYSELDIFRVFSADKWMSDYMNYRYSPEYLYEMACEMHMEDSIDDDALEHGFEYGLKSASSRIMLRQSSENRVETKFNDSNCNSGFIVTGNKGDLYIQVVTSGESKEMVDSLSTAEKAVMLRKVQCFTDEAIKNRINIIDNWIVILGNNGINQNDIGIQILVAEKNILQSIAGLPVRLVDIKEPEYKESYANKISNRYLFGAIIAGIVIGVAVDIVLLCILLRNKRVKEIVSGK